MIDIVLLVGRLLFVALLYLFLFAIMKTGIGLVKGQRIAEPVALKSGDVVNIGDVTMRVRYE